MPKARSSRRRRKPIKRITCGAYTLTVQSIDKPPYKFAVVRRHKGRSKRETEYFVDDKLALAKADAWEEEAGNVGAVAASTLTPSLKRDVMNWRLALEPFGKGIGDAVAFYLDHLKATRTSRPVAEIAEKLIAKKQKDGMRPRYLHSLRNCYDRFCLTFGERIMSEITHENVEDWLDGLDVGVITFNNTKRYLNILWSYALKQKKGWANENIIKAIDSRKDDEERKISYLTLERARGLLDVVRAEMIPYYSLGLFAGLRDSELQKLDWHSVNLQTGYIKIEAHVSKTRRMRLVPISQNLAAWLRPFVKASGPVAPENCDERKKQTKRDFELAGFEPLESNVLRHSFGTYRMAQVKNIGQVSEEMGNSPNVVKTHYQVSVPFEHGDQFFGIFPPAAGESNILPMIAENSKAA
jgi:integrase